MSSYFFSRCERSSAGHDWLGELRPLTGNTAWATSSRSGHLLERASRARGDNTLFRGWSVVASIDHVDKSLGSDFQFTRYTFEASYLLPLLTRRQVFGLRVGGTYLDGDIDDIPFYELAYLGGDRTLRGYFKQRFLGRAAALATAEYRLQLLDFQFFDLWQVRIDGVGFVEGGQVFISDEDVANQLGPEFVSTLGEETRYSYGGGLRFALGQALVAREA